MLDTVKNILVVLSGKGGVGKSTVSTQISIALRDLGFKVGLLDIDLCGPSVPHLLNIDKKEVHQSAQGWVPVFVDDEQRLAVMSIAFLLNSRDDAVVWRGPKKTGMIRQFLSDVVWENLDYLVIDTPPGTSDEHITLVESIRDKNCSAVIVTTPQHVAVEDARRQLTFCKKTGLPVLGVVENMSGYVCPSCSECTYLFSSGGGDALAKLGEVSLLGRLPIDPVLCELADKGESLLKHMPQSSASIAIKGIAVTITDLFPINK